jgi:uncharacterized protein DUF4214/methyltransferase family protein
MWKRWKARLEPLFRSDDRFIEEAYHEILGRPADQDGLNHYRKVLRQGVGRTAVLLSLMRSAEFTSKLTPRAAELPDLRPLRPDAYRETIDRSNGEVISTFVAADPADFDWLETAIIDHRYYEQPGVWNLGVDTDKRVAAEMLAAFGPSRALELGCAAGAILQCLVENGIDAEGVEISAMALARAPETVRSRIHQGDLLSLPLDGRYDLLLGLDVFEHLNPNRLDAYIARLRSLAAGDAFLFCNIPAFGHDDVFGTVFPLYVDGWAEMAANGRNFAQVHVDAQGFPIHGHLTWADAAWWQRRFEAQGFRRAPAVERALHAKYDAYLTKRSPARKAFFVFRTGASSAPEDVVIRRIQQTASAVLTSR